MLEQGHWIGGGFMWVFWIVLAVFIIWIVKASINNNSSSNNHPDERALEILKRRYANGEIDEAEFERKRKTLEKV